MALPAYSNGTSSVPLLGETIGANLERTTALFADREALVDVAAGRRWTYTELDADVNRLATGLHSLGIGAGDRVGIWSPNRAEWTLTQFATAKIGAILVTINPAYRSHELAFALKQSGCRALVSAPGFRDADYAATIEQVRGDLAELRTVLILDTPEWAALTATAADPELLARLGQALDPDDAINIQYTSGTTGFPKGATLTHHNILNNGYFVGELCGYSEADRICIPVPFYHCFGMVMGNLAAITHGSCMVIPAAGFDPALTLAAVEAQRCTSLYGVPTMFIAELALPDFARYDLTSLRTGIMAGSPCPVEIMKRVIEEMGCREVTICYGMTETSPVSTQTRADDSLERRVSTVGAVHPHLEVKVVDPSSGRMVDRNETGELCTRGYSVMRGYWNEPELSAAVLRNGWMHTGDLAVMDDDGYLSVVGRIKDMVIRGGENIYPREIEEFLYTHPAVADVQVVGVPDARYGEQLCAWVRLNSPGAVTAEELQAFCAQSLARFKVPRYVLFTEQFPTTVTGKVQKYKLRETSIAELGLDTSAVSRPPA